MVSNDLKFKVLPNEDSDSNEVDSNESSTDNTNNDDTSSDDTSSDENENLMEPTSANASVSHQDEDKSFEENELVQAILEARQLYRDHPPSFALEDPITDISFHPVADIIAVASLTGDIFLYKYNNEETNLTSTIEIHLKACRNIEFSEDGRSLFSTGKDQCVAITDTETEKLTRLYDKVHEQPIYTMTIINKHTFVTGDDDGVVKLWDLRQRGNDPIFSIKKAEDYISAMITNKDAKYLVCSSGDGCLTTINIPERRIHVQSEEYDEELTCLGLFKFERKLLSATSKGKMYMFNWGEFGLHSDEFPSATKKAINCMVPITENIVITGGEDGIIRATSLFPHVQLGIVGQHSFFIEALDISNDGTLVASTSHDNDVRFWNVKYFETLNVTEKVKNSKRERLAHNLPSSQISNRADFFTDLCDK